MIRVKWILRNLSLTLDEVFETLSMQSPRKDVGTLLGFSGSQRGNKCFVHILYQRVVGEATSVNQLDKYLLIPVFASNIVLGTKGSPFNLGRKNVSSVTNWKGCLILPQSGRAEVDVRVRPLLCQEQTDSHMD